MLLSSDRCAQCPNSHRRVMPDGPTPARYMLIGEGPGVNEDREGIPFCGVSGQEQNETYFRLAGLDRSEVFVTNAVQCRQERGGQDVRPADGLLKCCAANHLPEEIWTAQPEVIFLAGAAACSLVPGIDLELQHGYPMQVEACEGLAGWSGMVIPMYHPAAGMHESRFMIPLLADWERIGLWLRGKWEPPKPDNEDVDYQLCESINDFLMYVDTSSAWICNALDSENDEDRAWSIQFSHIPGTARMILVKNKKVIKEFREWAAEVTADWYMHNMEHDLDVTDSLAVSFRGEVFDTMKEIYHLAGSMPQGLKAAVYRAFGHRMTSYVETVTPHSKAALNVWLAEATAWVTENLRHELVHPIGKDCPSCGKTHRKDVSVDVPHEAEAVLRRIMGKLDDPASEYDPWQPVKWEKGKPKPRLLGRDWLGEIERGVGRMPRQSIVHAPLDEAVRYGCGDADWTGRLATWLEHERARIVQEEWSV